MTLTADSLAILKFYAALGVDEAIDDAPQNRLTAAAAGGGEVVAVERAPMAGVAVAPGPVGGGVPAQPAPRMERKPQATPPAPTRAPVAPVAPVEDARAAAAGAETVAALREIVAGFEGCALKATATKLCFADGPADAALMVIGEAPGAEEDVAGLPFVGKAGQLLDKMLAAIGLTRGRVYITNVIFWRPPGNRKPTPAELAVCLPFVRRQIALVRPRVLLLAGGTAANTVLENSEGITRLRGRWQAVDPDGLPTPPDSHGSIPALPSFHPAYLLRQPSAKREAWRDLLAVRARLDGDSAR